MRTTAVLNRIIDKIADSQAARLDSNSRRRDQTAESRVADSTPFHSVAGNDAAQSLSRLVVDSLASPTSRSRRSKCRQDADSAPSVNFSSHREVKSDATIGKTASARTFVSSNSRDERRTNLADAPISSERRDEDAKRKQRRRQIDPTTCERDYSADEIEFMKALDDYKRVSGRMFPTCSEILEVFKSLGYAKTTRRESGDSATSRDAPSQVRRASTPAFLGDEENDALDIDSSNVPGVA